MVFWTASLRLAHPAHSYATEAREARAVPMSMTLPALRATSPV
jgi:hypothetical protein